jgi:3-hydroxyisobutyrate dehydrogenase-like beta-hydroxyacid dehydrogenase
MPRPGFGLAALRLRSYPLIMALIALIGFGEAGQTFARAAGWKRDASAFDSKTDDPATRDRMIAAFGAEGVAGCLSLCDAVTGANQILSLVTADQALFAAKNAAQHHLESAVYFDMNSVAPNTKRQAAAIIDAAGGRYLDVAIMSPVNPARLSVPLLVSGAHSKDGVTALQALGFTNVRIVGADVGRASSIKMIRSIMVKGQEALTAEMILAARQADVVSEVLSSLGDDWPERARYNLERMTTHGGRRAAEMEEVAKTLESLGVEPLMTRGTIVRQREMAA